MVRYPPFSSTESYSHATATSHTPIHLSRPADSNETLANSIRPLAVELPQLLVSSQGGVPTDFSLVTATGGPQPLVIYHSLCLVCRILMRPFRTLADALLVHYPFFSSTESDSLAPAMGHTPFASSRPADSNETLADSIRQLAVELPELSVSFPCALITDLSLLPACGTASSPNSVYHQPVYSPLLYS